MTTESRVGRFVPNAMLDFYPALRAVALPCWFIRTRHEFIVLSAPCSTPAAAWSAALVTIRSSLSLRRVLHALAVAHAIVNTHKRSL